MDTNDWKSKFVTDYGVQLIPRFILVDPSGNIVNSNAPRPSDKKLITNKPIYKIFLDFRK
ncbi:hypothetical protein [uncultured Tenacibaculum sp.]|uniref:TlpA family protein disulfide reductase n=1 Tax=uncultured Tenacibaculum sp. TaxID=174713 RepID=UPI0026098D8D|nr:hypothetical protein [uncultured Tenacibaculum sp.]